MRVGGVITIRILKVFIKSLKTGMNVKDFTDERQPELVHKICVRLDSRLVIFCRLWNVNWNTHSWKDPGIQKAQGLGVTEK